MEKIEAIDTVELGQAVKRRRLELKMSLRDLEAMIEVSASTLSRIECGIGRPDADKIFRLTRWLDAPADRFLLKKDRQPLVYYPTESTPEMVRAILAVDNRLSERTIVMLGDLFNTMYKEFAR
jgi:transcriptional regulator with XRE-family HTH domain